MTRRLKLLYVVVVAGALGAFCAVALAASSPSVTTGHASSIKSTSAVLNGTINPNGSSTHFSFQLGLTKSYGVTIASKQVVSGTKAVAVKVTATNLLPGTTYHFRLTATNGVGSAVGADRTFRTSGNPPPAAATGPAYNVGTTIAFVTGVINPHNQQTSYVFQYGISTHYSAETLPHTIPAGNRPVAVSEQLSGLGPATLYHYRLVALHGTSVAQYGADAVFFTEPTHRPKPTLTARIRPRHDRSKPFVFTVFGRVAGVSQFPQFAACNGDVLVRFSAPHRRIGTLAIPVRSNCTFSGQAVFSSLPRHGGGRRLRVRVVAHFRGNGYLARARARAMHVTLG